VREKLFIVKGLGVEEWIDVDEALEYGVELAVFSSF
jgi:hypothetical protein